GLVGKESWLPLQRRGRGFAVPHKAYFSSARDLISNPVRGKDLAHSGKGLSFPVAPGCGGPEPGQNLDNTIDGWLAPFFPLMPAAPSYPSLFLPCSNGGNRRPRARRRGPRSRQETDAERRLLQEQTEREIDNIVAEFHAALAREHAKAVGAVYA